MSRTFAVIATVVALAATVPLAHAEERRIATLAPEGSLWMKQMEKGAAKVKQATDGRITTKYYGGGSQGDEKDVIRKIRLKQLDGAALTSVGLAIIYPGIRALQLPHFFADLDELDYVRKKTWPYFQKKFREEGFELLAPGDVGWIHLFSTKKIATKKDLENAKLWVWQGDPLASKLTDSLGINGVPLTVPEVLPALTSGRIDACFGSPLAAVALQWHTKVRYMTSLRVVYGIGGMVLRKDVWDSASEQDIEAQTKIGKKLMKQTIKRVRKDNGRALKALEREGLTVVQTPDDVIAEFEEQAEKMWEAGVGSAYTQAELDMVKKYRKEYRDKQAKSAKAE
jgi:TRAP-type C4-dicarboxylate transport system substrate-binding protein